MRLKSLDVAVNEGERGLRMSTENTNCSDQVEHCAHLPLCSLRCVKTTSQALGPGQNVTRDVAREYI